MEAFFFSLILVMLPISMIAGILGPFMIWKRISYFGDTLAHSALLAVSINSFSVYVPNIIAILIISILFSIILVKASLSQDVTLSILNTGSIGLSVFIITAFPNIFCLRINSILFGDILLVNCIEIIFLYLIALLVTVIFTFKWREWVMIAINENTAKIKGINVLYTKIEFIIVLALFISFAINIVGALLTTSLLILPAATARLFSRTPVQMILLSMFICFFGSILGLFLSTNLDSPTGVSIIVTLLIILIASFIVRYVINFLNSKLLNNA
jgi:zinc transport system permease protein